MQNRTSRLSDFRTLGRLGEGAFGRVFQVKRTVDGKEYALKKVKIGAMNQKERDYALNQIRILASYNEQYIIGYKDAFYDEKSAALYVVMEFAQGGDLFKRNQAHLKNITRHKQNEIWKALVHMTKGLKSLHDRKILHRDLKSANVFITAENVYKLGDLNVSKVLKQELAFTCIGTRQYKSPQVWKEQPYGLKSDIWSLGCVLYEMAALRPPFTATNLQSLSKKVVSGIFQRIPMIYSNQLATVISSLLKVDPQKRPNTQQLLSNSAVLKHYDGKYKYQNQEEQHFDELLKTIKCDPKNLKGLRSILPKANYEEDVGKKQKLKLQDLEGGIKSSKNSRIEPNVKEEIKIPFEENENKIAEFMKKKKLAQEKQRQRQLKMLMEQKQQTTKKRQRVISACGLRPSQNLYESPDSKITLINNNQMWIKGSQSQNKGKNEEIKCTIPKVHPKPQGVQNMNFKLPPIPSLGHNEQKQQLKQNAQINKGKLPISAIGNRPKRSSSLSRKKYPSWWGE